MSSFGSRTIREFVGLRLGARSIRYSSRCPRTGVLPRRPPPGGKCAASYPSVCIPPPPRDLNCTDIPYRNFRVRWDVLDPDPHHFDGNHDGVGCES